MDSAAREVLFMTREQNTEGSSCPMALLPPEIQKHILSYISTQESLSRLGHICRAWYEVANEELYKRDSREYNSFAIKWMAAHAVDEQTTDSALRTLEVSRQWGGQIDAIQRVIPTPGLYRTSYEELYEKSTALHFAVFLGNVRLTKTLLDMEASLEIPCPSLLWQSIGSEEVLLRFRDFQQIFEESPFDSAFSIFLAFLQSDSDMCNLLIENGAGREATLVETLTGPKAVSILHFAAADPTTDYRKWQCLFHEFRKYIDEPCPRRVALTPLHVALMVGCTQGMEMAVEYGADKEARDGCSSTPLTVGMKRLALVEDLGLETFDERTICFRKFVELGASVNPEGDSVLLHALRPYALRASKRPGMRHLIYFLLEHHANIHETSDWHDRGVVLRIIHSFTSHRDQDPETQELLKELLSDLIDRGLNLATTALGWPSPLYYMLHNRKADPEWLFDMLCENGAAVREDEFNTAFVHWCEIPRLWRTNSYDAWWQHKGQEDGIFQKWCEHPYNAWWWQHVKHISRIAVRMACRQAFSYGDRQLYDILTHLPLPVPLDELLVQEAFYSLQPWSWRQVVLREFEDDFVATSSFERENMVHLTVRVFIDRRGYSADDAIQDIVHLRDKGVDVTSRNGYGKTPREVLFDSDSGKDGKKHLASLLKFLGMKVVRGKRIGISTIRSGSFYAYHPPPNPNLNT